MNDNCPICTAQRCGLEDGFAGKRPYAYADPDQQAAYLFAYKRGEATRKRVQAGLRHSGECGGER